MKEQSMLTEVDGDNKDNNEESEKLDCVLQVKIMQSHIDKLKEIAKHYRSSKNVSHAVRLMIEDKYDEINGIIGRG